MDDKTKIDWANRVLQIAVNPTPELMAIKLAEEILQYTSIPTNNVNADTDYSVQWTELNLANSGYKIQAIKNYRGRFTIFPGLKATKEIIDRSMSYGRPLTNSEAKAIIDMT